MTKGIFLGLLILTAAFLAGAAVVHAALSFGSGTYVNLCGSGTAATAYTCDPGCNPAVGVCQGENTGVVKWTCTGKWNQCFESESSWSNREEIGSVGCNKTVQISLFDKKCRREDGSWDQSCVLKGYMVWYSGECGGSGGGVATPAVTAVPTVVPSPTLRPVASPTVAVSKFSLVPSPTVKPTAVPTSKPAVKVCGKKCAADGDCAAGFACVGGLCRNPSCPADAGCFCGNVGGAATGSGTPETGVETWIILAVTAGAVGVGIRMRRLAKRLW